MLSASCASHRRDGGSPVHVAAHVEGRRCAGGRGPSCPRDQHAASAMGRRAPIAKSGGSERRPGRGRPSTTSAARTLSRACEPGSGFAGRSSRRGRSGRRDARSASPRPRGAARTASWCGPRCASPSICCTEVAPRSPRWRRQAARCGVPYAIDLEDFHGAEQVDSPAATLSHALAQRIERDVLPGALFLTASSPGIAAAYADRYGVSPIVVHNTFPLPSKAARSPILTRTGRLRLYWFSQTIGPGRGLEDVVSAMALADRAGRAPPARPRDCRIRRALAPARGARRPAPADRPARAGPARCDGRPLRRLRRRTLARAGTRPEQAPVPLEQGLHVHSRRSGRRVHGHAGPAAAGPGPGRGEPAVRARRRGEPGGGLEAVGRRPGVSSSGPGPRRGGRRSAAGTGSIPTSAGP